MSRFIEKLRKVGEVGPSPMGFGVSSRQDRVPTMLLVGTLSLEELNKRLSKLEATVDALLISLGKGDQNSLPDLKKPLGSLLWGLRIESGPSERFLEQAQKSGCDFLVFDAEVTPAHMLLDEDVGKIVTVDMKLDEATARGIEDLPIDALMLTLPDSVFPLTVRRLIDIQAVRSFTSKNFLLAVPAVLGGSEINSFRELGVDCLVVDLEKADLHSVQKMREAIDKLPKKKPRSEKMGAVLPRVGMGFGAAPPNQEDGEEQEEDS